jgi:hypothetical protein
MKEKERVLLITFNEILVIDFFQDRLKTKYLFRNMQAWK